MSTHVDRVHARIHELESTPCLHPEYGCTALGWIERVLKAEDSLYDMDGWVPEVEHIKTETGCVISFEGQGHFPCGEHS